MCVLLENTKGLLGLRVAMAPLEDLHFCSMGAINTLLVCRITEARLRLSCHVQEEGRGLQMSELDKPLS